MLITNIENKNEGVTKTLAKANVNERRKTKMKAIVLLSCVLQQYVSSEEPAQGGARPRARSI